MMFVDQVRILIKSGRGGDGHVSFHREKYITSGGPDGGDGGHGGNIIFKVNRNINTLYKFKHRTHYKAQAGEPGGKRNCSGKTGEDLIIEVPLGTIIKDADTGLVIKDLAYLDTEATILRGGKGGKGNQHYATPTMQIPKYAQPGQEAIERWVILELKTIADVGLVGYPNVGKSTFLSRCTNAQPKIANYHFTTLNPNLGVVEIDQETHFVIADIPGLIEGAAEGVGLGHEFLKHIERTKILLHIVDVAGTEGRDPVQDLESILHELEAFNPDLLKKPQIIAANKMDVLQDEENLQRLKDTFEPRGLKVFPISGVSGQGIPVLLYELNNLIISSNIPQMIFEPEVDLHTLSKADEPIIVTKVEDNLFSVEGSRIERMLSYTNLDSEKGFQFFQNFLKESGVLLQLENLGIVEGDTVKLYFLEFDYYK